MTKVLFSTAGDGYWSNAQKTVEITDMRLGYVDEDKEFGELCVYFNTATWDVNKDGLIYTDSLFRQELMAFIEQHGLVVDLCYSEQGMQGDDYVSFDIGADFLRSWEAKFGEYLKMFNDKQNKLMLEAVELLHKADALMQEALGASDECYDLHCAIESVADDLLETIQENNPVDA